MPACCTFLRAGSTCTLYASHILAAGMLLQSSCQIAMCLAWNHWMSRQYVLVDHPPHVDPLVAAAPLSPGLRGKLPMCRSAPGARTPRFRTSADLPASHASPLLVMHRPPLQVGHGFRVMTVDEWSARWKKNEAWPECLQCGSKNTKEHHFTQVGRWRWWWWWWCVRRGAAGVYGDGAAYAAEREIRKPAQWVKSRLHAGSMGHGA